MNVLSLFDGMSCAQIALERANIKVDRYYASEVDKYAVKVTQANYPDTIQLGDVTALTQMEHFKHPIDLLVGGSPCQGFSFASKHRLNFDDPRSKLFFEFVRLKKELKPKYFLLENVRMKQEHQDVISEYLGVEPIMINSALLSAQNRVRLYWTNIPDVSQPDDKGLVLADILEHQGEVDRSKSYCIDANYWKGGNRRSYFNNCRRQLVFADGAMRGGYKEGGGTQQQLEFRSDDKSNAITTVQKDSVLAHRCIKLGHARDIKGHDFMKRVYSPEGKAPTLTAVCGGNQERKVAVNSVNYRKLTPVECERLQTVPDNYTNAVSNTQRYRMLGNGFTVDVIAHILKNMDV